MKNTTTYIVRDLNTRRLANGSVRQSPSWRVFASRKVETKGGVQTLTTNRRFTYKNFGGKEKAYQKALSFANGLTSRPNSEFKSTLRPWGIHIK
jgi:hypothetical protein